MPLGRTTSIVQHNTFTIVQQPGQSPREFARFVIEEMDRETTRRRHR